MTCYMLTPRVHIFWFRCITVTIRLKGGRMSNRSFDLQVLLNFKRWQCSLLSVNSSRQWSVDPADKALFCIAKRGFCTAGRGFALQGGGQQQRPQSRGSGQLASDCFALCTFLLIQCKGNAGRQHWVFYTGHSKVECGAEKT